MPTAFLSPQGGSLVALGSDRVLLANQNVEPPEGMRGLWGVLREEPAEGSPELRDRAGLEEANPPKPRRRRPVFLKASGG